MYVPPNFLLSFALGGFYIIRWIWALQLAHSFILAKTESISLARHLRLPRPKDTSRFDRGVRWRQRTFVVVALTSVCLSGGCTSKSAQSGGGNSSATSDSASASRSPEAGYASLCTFLSKVNGLGNRAPTPQAGLKDLSELAKMFDVIKAHTPQDEQADLIIVFKASRMAIADHKLSSLASNAVVAAGKRLYSRC